MLRHWTRSVSVPLLAVALTCALPVSSAAQAPAAEAAEASPAMANAWWNQARFIERLALSPDGRQQMDAILAEHLESADPKARAQTQAKLHEALLAGDWDAARAALDGVNTARTASFNDQTELKIEILKLLSSEQRQVIADNFPRLIARPWVKPQRDGAKRG
ncbi:MAG: hypothetical protein AAFY88_27800, partial [Acidobacteriota bacterium]